MCIVFLDHQPDAPWPLLLAGNRDERVDRHWQAPDRHWPDRPEVLGGRDATAGGSWLGLNDWGVVACVLNRRGTLGPEPGRRSRGDLVLEALDHADASAAAAALVDLDPVAWRPFNLIVADNRDVFWIRHAEATPRGRVTCHRLAPGRAILSADDLNAADDPRVATHLPRLAALPRPDPDADASSGTGTGTDTWAPWTALLADTTPTRPGAPRSAVCIPATDGFGTVNAALVALPAMARADTRPLLVFAPGPPDRTPFSPVLL